MLEASGLGEAYLGPRNEGIPSIGEACGGWSIRASQERSDEAVSALWRTRCEALCDSQVPHIQVSCVRPIEVHRESLGDFCEELVEQRHQVGLKNNLRTKGVRNRDWKRKLYSEWEQLGGNPNVQSIKVELKESWKRKICHDRGAETAAALQMEKDFSLQGCS